MIDDVLAGLERVRAADDAAIDALAFAAAGRFDEYWQGTIDDIHDRISGRLATPIDEGEVGSSLGDSDCSPSGSVG